jgi:hypothetical protein
MLNRYLRVLVPLAALVLLAAACGGDDATTTSAPPSQTTAPAPPPATAAPVTATPPVTSTPPATTTAPTTMAPPETVTAPVTDGGTVDGGLTFSLADEYTAIRVDDGVKPDLALAPDGTPGITYLLEDRAGFISYADASGGWVPERVIDGYFYGPIGLAYAPDGVPHIVYHDHQDIEFKPDKGDLTLAIGGDGWTIEPATDDGHDGWDSTIAIGPDGLVRAAGIDPAQFDSTDGVEYYEFRGGRWNTLAIGSGAVDYEFNVSLAVDPEANPALTYYDTTNADLMFASRNDGVWSIETVDADGDTGRYSSLAFDEAGNAHISYLRLDGPSDGTVRYASRQGDTWTTTDIDTLSAVRTGFTGARRLTAIAVDVAQQPHIVYSDESVVKHATSSNDAWTATQLVTAGDRALGQLVSFALGEDGGIHLAIFEVTAESPLSGVVAYIASS